MAIQKTYPFKFLNTYDKEDKAIFFGREEEIEALYKMVFQTNLLLVYGASGTGKSSLVRCGLANKFKVTQWQDVYIRRGENINESLLTTVQKEVNKTDTQNTLDDDLEWLKELVAEEGDKTNTLPHQEDNSPTRLSQISEALHSLYLTSFNPVFLIFDQFEELYTLGNEAEQKEFISIIDELIKIDIPLKIILIMREEYFGRLYEFEQTIPQLREKRLRLEPMTLQKAQEVILKSTVQNPSSCISLAANQEEAIAKAITENIREDDVNIKLPYLQVYIDRLHERVRTDKKNRNESVTFSKDLIEEVGEIKEVLTNFIEKQSQKVFTALSTSYPKLPTDIVWSVLSPFATLEGTKIPMRVGDFPVIANEIKGNFANANIALQFVKACTNELEKHRILRFRNDDKTYEVLHDTLAKEIAEKRSEEEKAVLRVKRLIESKSALEGISKSLFTARELAYIEPVVEKLSLSVVEEQLIEESYAAVASEEKAKLAAQKVALEKAQAQAAKEKELREKAEKAGRRTKFVAFLAISLAVLAGVFGVFAQQSAKEAERSAKAEALSAKNARNAQKNADSLRLTALWAKDNADSLREVAVIEKVNALNAKQVAIISESKAKDNEEKALNALEEVAKLEIKAAHEKEKIGNRKEVLEHIKRATISQEKEIIEKSTAMLIRIIIAEMFEYDVSSWGAKEFSNELLAFKKSKNGVVINFENKGIPLFQKAFDQSLRNNKPEAMNIIISAMKKEFGNELVEEIYSDLFPY